MAIPKYEDVMLPLLKLLEDAQTRKFADLVPLISDALSLSSEERDQMIPSGRMTTIRSRAHWAAFYMDKAKLLHKPKRGFLQIAPRGQEILTRQPASITVELLNQFPEFREFRARSGVNVKPPSGKAEVPSTLDSELSPEETLEIGYQTLRLQLAGELLERLISGSPKFFEQVVVDLLVAMGYGGSRPDVFRAIGKSGDGGIDGVINEDRLGLDVVYVQAKRWSDSVGSAVVREFTGSLEGQRANKGVLITTSNFTTDAKNFAKSIGKRIVLIEGTALAKYMIDHDVGVTVASTYVVKRIDGDYFEEE